MSASSTLPTQSEHSTINRSSPALVRPTAETLIPNNDPRPCNHIYIYTFIHKWCWGYPASFTAIGLPPRPTSPTDFTRLIVVLCPAAAASFGFGRSEIVLIQHRSVRGWRPARKQGDFMSVFISPLFLSFPPNELALKVVLIKRNTANA